MELRGVAQCLIWTGLMQNLWSKLTLETRIPIVRIKNECMCAIRVTIGYTIVVVNCIG